MIFPATSWTETELVWRPSKWCFRALPQDVVEVFNNPELRAACAFEPSGENAGRRVLKRRQSVVARPDPEFATAIRATATPTTGTVAGVNGVEPDVVDEVEEVEEEDEEEEEDVKETQEDPAQIDPEGQPRAQITPQEVSMPTPHPDGQFEVH